MRKLLVLFLALLPLTLSAQIYIRGRNATVFPITAAVVDSLSGEPVAFSSVYLRPVGDTLITHFTLSDQNGKAILDQVTRGEYTLNVEFLGYKPYRKNYYFSGRKDLGTIKLQEDHTQIEAARVSAAVTPMEMRGDTLVYNAAAFQVEENDVLKDLLKKMPGVEVGDDGSVTVQGETVQKITVNGRTFFTGSNSAALDNLPAKAVDKIKVTDHESDQAAVTGIRKIGNSGKSMDVGLKQEYSRGTFGRIGASAGASIPDKGQDEMLGGDPFLWNVNGMLSTFGKRDQVTVVARGQNVNTSDRVRRAAGGGSGGGLSTTGQAGVNYTTDRIAGYETGASVFWNGRSTRTGTRSSTINYPASGEEFVSDSRRAGTSGGHGVDLSMSLRPTKNDGKYWLSFSPRFTYNRSSSTSASNSSTMAGEDLRNKSESASSSLSDSFGASGGLTFIYTGFSNRGRNLSAALNYNASTQNGVSTENSSSWMSVGNRTVDRDLHYNNGGGSLSTNLSLSYVEPLSEKWSLQAAVNGAFQRSRNDRAAFNADNTENDYYSTLSRHTSYQVGGQFLAQWVINTKHVLQFGATGYTNQLVTYSKAQGMESTIGEGEWLWSFAPFLRYSLGDFMALYSGSSSQPSHSQMVSLLNIADPTRISTGNVYLKTSFSHGLTLSYRTPRSKDMRFLMVDLNAQLVTNPVVTASWFDASSVRYSIPVMARRPTVSLRPALTFMTPLDRDSRWRMTIGLSGLYSRTVNYQAAGILAGIDTDTFDYADFMRGFWGSESGDVFYGGGSGFRESVTHQMSLIPSVNTTYNGEHIQASANLRASGHYAWYSVDTQANSQTWVATATLSATWMAPLDFQLNGMYSFNRYFGYSDGFANATHHLNISLTKNIKAFTLSLQARDLLNQGLSIVHNVDADSVSDSYSLSLGRNILFGVTWNFGRMNARNSRTADRVNMQMEAGTSVSVRRSNGGGGRAFVY